MSFIDIDAYNCYALLIGNPGMKHSVSLHSEGEAECSDHTWVTQWMERNGMLHTWVTDGEKQSALHLGYRGCYAL